MKVLVVLLVTLSVALAEEQQVAAEKKTGKRGIFDTAYYGNNGYGYGNGALGYANSGLGTYAGGLDLTGANDYNRYGSRPYSNGGYYNSLSGNNAYSGLYGNNAYSGLYGNNAYSGLYGNSAYSGLYGNNAYSGLYGNNGYYGSAANSGYYGSGANNGYYGSAANNGYYGANGYNSGLGNRWTGSNGWYGSNGASTSWPNYNNGYVRPNNQYGYYNPFYNQYSQYNTAAYRPPYNIYQPKGSDSTGAVYRYSSTVQNFGPGYTNGYSSAIPSGYSNGYSSGYPNVVGLSQYQQQYGSNGGYV